MLNRIVVGRMSLLASGKTKLVSDGWTRKVWNKDVLLELKEVIDRVRQNRSHLASPLVSSTGQASRESNLPI